MVYLETERASASASVDGLIPINLEQGFCGRVNIRPGSGHWSHIGELKVTHNSPEHSKALVEQKVGATTAWVRSNTSFERVRPIWKRTRDCFALVYGEIFSDSAVPAGAEEQEIDIARSIIIAYRKDGLQSFERLNGWFCGLIVDFREHITTLFNDRYGLGRVYYYQGNDMFYFATEAKAILKLVPSLRQLDIRSLGEFLSCDCVLEDRTLFRNVFLLPPGSAWIFRSNRAIEKRRYFHPSTWEDKPRLSPKRYYDSLRQVFPNVLKRYLRHPHGVGMSLTGGLDCRLAMAWAQALPGELPCYTFGSSFAETADVAIARRVASVCKQPHCELRVNGEFLDRFPQFAEEAIRISDGTMDVTGAAELYVNQLARQVKPVRLTGNYGSEILRGNVAFRSRPVLNNVFDSEIVGASEQASATYAEASRDRRRSFVAFKQVPWYHFARSALERSQLIVRSPYLDNDLVELSFQAPEGDDSNFDACLRVAAEGNSELARIPTDRGIRYGANRLQNYLKYSTAQFFIKGEYAYDYGMPGWLARLDRIMSRLTVERMFLGRQKFCHFRTWYKRELARFVRELLLDRRTSARPFWDRRSIEHVVSSHITGRANHTLLIHKLLSLELIHRTLLEQN